MSFANPALLAGVALAVLPVLIHLLLRPRPRRIIFPALTLLHAALVAGQRASRVRNLALLAVRAASVAALALLLAGPTCDRSGHRAASNVEELQIVLVDDSLSLSYLGPAGPRYETLRDSALAAMRAAGGADRPVWSLHFSSLGDAQSPELLDLESLARRWSAHPNPPNARPLGAALRHVAETRRESRDVAARVWIVTDLAAHAWRDVESVGADLAHRLRVTLVGPDDAADNLSLAGAGPVAPAPAGVAAPRRALPAGELCDCPVRVRSFGVAASTRVLAGTRSGSWGASAETPLGQNDSATVVVRGGPADAGVLGVEFVLEPADRLDFDQRYFGALEFAPPPVAWVVEPPAPSRPDLGRDIIGNLIAPAVLPPEQHLARLTASADPPPGLADPATRRAALIVATSDALGGPAQQRAVVAQVERGAQLLLLPSDSAEGRIDWPGLRELLADRAPRVESGDARADWTPASVFAAPVGSVSELARCRLTRTLAITRLAADATVHARRSDGAPFIASRALGDGHVWLLGASPDPGWGELGVRAAALLTLLDGLIRAGSARCEHTAQFEVGQTTRMALPGAHVSGTMRVLSLTGSSPPVWRRVTDGVPDEPWPTDAPGLFEIRAAGGARHATYAVNWPEYEGDLRGISEAEVAERLGPPTVTHRTPGEAHAPPPLGWIGGLRRWFSTDGLIAAALIALLCLEMVLAGRARRPAKTEAV